MFRNSPVFRSHGELNEGGASSFAAVFEKIRWRTRQTLLYRGRRMTTRKTRVAHRSDAARTRRSARDGRVVTVTLGGLGIEPRRVQVRSGTTLRDLVRTEGYSGSSVRLNRRATAPSRQLRNGDRVVVLPHSIVGAARQPAHLALESYRNRLTPADYRFLTAFLGADSLGFTQADFGGW